MRFPKSALLGIAVLTGAALNAQEIKLNLEPTAPEAPPAFTDAQAIEAFGWFLAHQSGLVALGFSREEIELMSRGMATAVSGEPSPHEFEKIGPTIQALIAKRKDDAFARMRAQGLAETAKFMTDVRAKAGVVSMDNGMAYEVVSAGAGPKPRAEQWVKVNYVGKLVSGAVFDRSEEGKPVEFQLSGVIDGWREGLQNVNQGSKVILYIPPHLAYGDNGTPEIPPGSTLIFEVELVEVNDAATDAAAGATAPATGG